MTRLRPLLFGAILVATGFASGCDAPEAGEPANPAQSVQEEELETRFRAEIRGPSAIRFTLEGAERPDSVEA